MQHLYGWWLTGCLVHKTACLEPSSTMKVHLWYLDVGGSDVDQRLKKGLGLKGLLFHLSQRKLGGGFKYIVIFTLTWANDPI